MQYGTANSMDKTSQEIIDIPKKSIKCRRWVGEWEGTVERTQKYVLFISLVINGKIPLAAL